MNGMEFKIYPENTFLNNAELLKDVTIIPTYGDQESHPLIRLALAEEDGLLSFYIDPEFKDENNDFVLSLEFTPEQIQYIVNILQAFLKNNI